jgi:hypothetical protein
MAPGAARPATPESPGDNHLEETDDRRRAILLFVLFYFSARLGFAGDSATAPKMGSLTSFLTIY